MQVHFADVNVVKFVTIDALEVALWKKFGECFGNDDHAKLLALVVLSRANRRDDILSPQAKVSANYASPMTAKARARAQGYDEIILVDEDGNLAEGPTTNLFIVDDKGELLTPASEKVLHGVTRSSIIELAKAEGIPFREAPIKAANLLAASEAFMTGTTAGVWCIESVDGTEIGSVCPGPISMQLRDRFLRVSEGEDPEFEHWLTRIED